MGSAQNAGPPESPLLMPPPCATGLNKQTSHRFVTPPIDRSLESIDRDRHSVIWNEPTGALQS
jgi:hypothetical protein